MRRIAFLAVPLGIFETQAYQAALRRLWLLYPPPKDRILSSRHIWSSTAEWLANYRDALAAVTDMFIVPDHGYAGLGVFTEWAYLWEQAACYAFTSSGCIVPVATLSPLERPTPRCWAIVLDVYGKVVS